MPTPNNNYYLAPAPFPFNPKSLDSYRSSLSGWAKEFIEQGNAYLRLQPAYPYIQEGLDLINGTSDPSTTATLSSAKTESVVRNIKELIAAQTNLRIIPAFKTESDTGKPQAALLNKLYMSWQTMTFADRQIRKAWQFAASGGTGYLSIKWEPNYYYRGKGEIALDAHGPLDVIPVGLPESHNLQAGYGTAIRVPTPWHEVIRKFPEYRDKISPSSQNSLGRGNVIAQSVKFASSALRRYMPGANTDPETKPWPTVDLYYIYLDDDSVNNTGRELLMGDPGTSWEHIVPFIGQQIPAGHDAHGNAVFRNATPTDCLLYPNRRRIIMEGGTWECLNPDPTTQVNPYWHAKVPVVQWRADDWAWSYLGFPLSKAGSSLEKANIQMLRALVDSYNVMMSPPRAYDRNTMSSALAQAINPRIPNQTVGLDLTFANEQFKPLLPAEYYRIPGGDVNKFLETNEARIKQQMGVADAAAMARSRQLPSGDSLEKILDALGPVIKDQSRNMETSVCGLGDMWKSLAFQFYTANRRMSLLGQTGLTEEDWDFKPGELTPESLPGMEGSSRFDIAKTHSAAFQFSVTPYSLHEFNSTSRKLLILQLSRFGFPISWWTQAQAFDIPNFGPKPQIQDPDTGLMREASTELELWLSQQEMMARMKAASEPQGGGGQGKGKGGGRPPSGHQPPTLDQKADGRPIVRESSK